MEVGICLNRICLDLFGLLNFWVFEKYQPRKSWKSRLTQLYNKLKTKLSAFGRIPDFLVPGETCLGSWLFPWASTGSHPCLQPITGHSHGVKNVVQHFTDPQNHENHSFSTFVKWQSSYTSARSQTICVRSCWNYYSNNRTWIKRMRRRIKGFRFRYNNWECPKYEQ